MSSGNQWNRKRQPVVSSVKSPIVMVYQSPEERVDRFRGCLIGPKKGFIFKDIKGPLLKSPQESGRISPQFHTFARLNNMITKNIINITNM